ncbi:response regulator transcription factor [Candidatus Obscuribacterales bacterium]|nr:response regulator transcription factor [Candidatus Obscuribacterales bacterium]
MKARMGRILLVEDDEMIASVVEDVLSEHNHVVDLVSTGPDALDQLLHYHYDMAIIDWGLPGMPGYTVTEQYRGKGGKIPILFLTGQTDVVKKVQALDVGADDYICKPFAVDELIARVTALLRRPPVEDEKVVKSGSLQLDLATCQVTISGAPLALTAGEFALLKLFMQNPGKVFSISSIVDKIFQSDAEFAEKAVRQRVMVLRKKLSVDGHEESIVTVTGQGYKFEARG